MRLIDADKLLQKILDISYFENQDEDVFWNSVVEAPTEVTTCEFCKFKDEVEDGSIVCTRFYDFREKEDFCSYGVKKEDLQ